MSKVKWIELGDIALGDVVQLRGTWVQVSEVSFAEKRTKILIAGESADGDIHTYIDEGTAMVRSGTEGDLV